MIQADWNGSAAQPNAGTWSGLGMLGVNRQTGRQADRQVDGQTDRHVDRQAGRQTGRWRACRHTDKHTDRQVDICWKAGRRTNTQKNRWTDK